MIELTSTELQAIAQATLSIPTGDNCQPFRLKWTAKHLEIWYLPERGNHALNHKDHASLISLGCLLEAVEIACSTLDLKIDINYPSSEFENHLHWANISFSRQTTTADELYSSLPNRVTDRRFYQSLPVTQEDIDGLCGHPTIRQGQFQFSKINPQLSKIVKDADEYVWETKQVYQDLFHWMRLSKKETLAQPDGMSARNMGMNTIETWLFRFLRKFKIFVAIIWPLGFRLGLRIRNGQILKHSSGVVLYSDQLDSPGSYVTAGRRCFRFWLALTKKGLAAQPLSTASFVLTSSYQSQPPVYMSNKFIRRFRQAYGQIQTQFGLDTQESPVWMFRIGKPTTSKSVERTRRQTLSQYLTTDKANKPQPEVSLRHFG